MSGRIIHVAPGGDDLDGDGSAERPFASEARAELEGEPGDMIVTTNFPPPTYLGWPATPLSKFRKGVAMFSLPMATGLAVGLTFHEHPVLTPLIVAAGVVIFVFAVVDD